MLNRIGNDNWILCTGSLGYACPEGTREPTRTYFPLDSVGAVEAELGDEVQVFLPGQRASYIIPTVETQPLNVAETGKGFPNTICNRCFVLKPETYFARNQTDARGNKTRRPSCRQCRLEIEGRPLSRSEKAAAAARRPRKGALWQCPLCRKFGIADINMPVRLDHDRHRGLARSYICDSCNTGLGRFMNGENLLNNAIAYVLDWENRR